MTKRRDRQELKERVRKRFKFKRLTGWIGYKPYQQAGLGLEEIWNEAIEEYERQTKEVTHTYTPVKITDAHVMYKKRLKGRLGFSAKVTTYVEGRQVHSITLDIPDTIREFNKQFWSDNWIKFTEYKNGFRAPIAWHELADMYVNETDEQIDARAGSVTIKIVPETKLNPVKIEQKFREGINNCLLQPIRNWALDTLSNAKSKTSIKRYNTILNKLKGYEAKYMFGVPEADLQMIANDLQIDINVEFPLKAADQYITVKSDKKRLRPFNFVNTRMDHVDVDPARRYAGKRHNGVVTVSEPEKVTEQQLLDIRDGLIQDGTHYTYKKDVEGNIISIMTLSTTWQIGSEYHDAVKHFEEETGLVNCYLDFMADNEVSTFIDSGVHFNLTRDFVDDIDTVDKEGLRHIDMERAYARFHNCRHYAGFPGKVTDFRECRGVKIEFVRENLGYYLIENLRLDVLDPAKVRVLRHMNLYENVDLYGEDVSITLPSVELVWLHELGATFDVLQGCWGSRIDFRFPQEFEDKKDGKVRYYAKWTGQQKSFRTHRNIFMTGTEAFFCNILSHLDGQQSGLPTEKRTRVKYFLEKQQTWEGEAWVPKETVGQGEGVIEYPKDRILHLAHIAGFITSYQRLAVLEQLFAMDFDKLVRVCVDGIYFYDHPFDMNARQFTRKPEMRLGNAQADSYMTNGYWPGDELPAFRPQYRRELFLGAGGNGKTHVNLIDKGFIKPIYIAPSWKLARAKAKEYGCEVSVLARAYHPVHSLPILKKHNVLIFDEASMISQWEKDMLFDIYEHAKLIFCGDVGYQLPPIAGNPITHDGFDNIVTLTENHRFKDKGHYNTCMRMRGMIDEGASRDEIRDFVKASYQNVCKDQVPEMYDPAKDIILASKHTICDEWTSEFPDNKWKCTEKNQVHAVGEIVLGEPPKGRYEKRHGFTIHSVQGETYEGKIFIDIRNMFDLTMLYTAVSRARRSDQIHIIVGLEDHKTLPGKIYIIESPNTDKVYVGSTFKTLEVRFRGHQSRANKTESKLVIAAGGATIRLLTEVKCINRQDLEARERECIARFANAVNKKLTAGL